MMLSRVLLLFGFGFVTVLGYQNHNNSHTTNEFHPAVFCYINGSRLISQSRHNFQTTYFGPEHIKLDLCTHLVYGAAFLDPRDWGIKPIDPDLEKRQSVAGKISLEDMIDLKNQKRDLKVLISISGHSRDFSNVAKNHRADFIQNVKNFLHKYKFDGINIDWRYPGRSGGNREDKHNFVLLMTELKVTLRQEAKLLTAAISPIQQNIIDGYDHTSNILMDAVDYWFIMALEYYGHSSYAIGANAPIRSRELLHVKKTMDDFKMFFQHHFYKLVLVIPFYGKIYQLKHTLESNESPIGKGYANMHVPPESVILSYREVCQKMNNEKWIRGWDMDSETPYIVKDTQAILYEDAQSVQAKTNLALKYKMGGVMAFSIDMDDYEGVCGALSRSNMNDNHNYGSRVISSQKYPLLQAMYDTVERRNSAAVHQHSSLLTVLFATFSVMMVKVYG